MASVPRENTCKVTFLFENGASVEVILNGKADVIQKQLEHAKNEKKLTTLDGFVPEFDSNGNEVQVESDVMTVDMSRVFMFSVLKPKPESHIQRVPRGGVIRV